MAVQVQKQIKVLRIGILQDGKIVQEKRIRPGETVTIGESPKSTFSYKLPKIPAKFPIFVAKGETYTLRFVESMSGKVAFGENVSSLEQLRAKGPAVKKGDAWSLQLNESNRGKISVGNLTVLFQFVPAPPEPLHPTTRTDFKPKVLDENDPAFVGFLGLYSLLALIFVVYVYNVEPVDEVSIDEIPDRIVELVIVKQPDNKVNDQALGADQEEKEVKTKKPEQADDSQANAAPARPISAEEREAAALKKKMEAQAKVDQLILKMLGTKGESTSGAMVEDLIGEGQGVGQDLSSALKQVGGATQGTADALALAVKGGSGEGTGRGDATIGDLQKVGGGSGKLTEGTTTRVRSTVRQEKAEVTGGDAARVKSVVNGYMGQVQTCYEQQLKEHPKLAGRIEVSWSIVKGKVVDAQLIGNSTGNDMLGSCIIGKVKRWRFPEDLEKLDILSYPFVFVQE